MATPAYDLAVTTRVVVLDAMGVIYQAQDDVQELLIPYARELGCVLPDTAITDLYRRASLGEFDSTELWRRCAVNGDDEQYCNRHQLTVGIPELLVDLVSAGIQVACLSNDVSAWSVLLRNRFKLTQWISTWVISADIGVRKPSEEAYRHLLDAVEVEPYEVLFVDDRSANVAAAAAMEIPAMLFSPSESLDAIQMLSSR